MFIRFVFRYRLGEEINIHFVFFLQMEQAGSSCIRPTASNRRKKTCSKARSTSNMSETQEQPSLQLERDTESPVLLMNNPPTNVPINTDEEEYEEDIYFLIQGGLVDMTILKSFRTHVEFSIIKWAVSCIKLLYYFMFKSIIMNLTK